MRCENCGRILGTNWAMYVTCPCGHQQLVVPVSPTERRDPIYRNHLRQYLPTCEQCEHWKDASCGTGCGLLKKPCQISKHLLFGFGCVDTPQRFPAAEAPTTTNGVVRDLVAVTSLGPHSYQQRQAIQTWIDIGLEVVCVQTKGELDSLRNLYPVKFIECDDNEMPFTPKTQRIWRLTQVARELNTTVMICNADIEIYGRPKVLNDVERTRNVLTIGIRHNYPRAHYKAAKREPWGIDAFFITPAMAETLPNLGLGIGHPVWDYWLPLHFLRRGYRIACIGQPFFYHREHDRTWTESDWARGCDVVEECYGVRLSPSFRELLPYGTGSTRPEARKD